MKLHLRDRKIEMVNAWLEVFDDVPDVTISHSEDFFAGMKEDAVVSPANSFGFMDGGIDDLYSIHFGRDLQDRLQAMISGMAMREVIVGDAVNVKTGDTSIPLMICAPTMRVPSNVADTANAFLATRAALVLAQALNLNSILCPGMCTGVGRMPAKRCAIQMRAAWDHVMSEYVAPATWHEAQQRHEALCKAG